MSIIIPAEPESVEIDPRRTAVIVVDMQNGFCSKGGLLDIFDRLNGAKIGAVIRATRKTISAARKAGIPIVYLKHTYSPDLSNAGGPESPNYWKELAAVAMREHPEYKGKFLTSGTWDWEIIEELKPLPADIIVEKNRFSGFTNPQLNSILHQHNIKYLIFLGVATNVCVESTLRDSFFNEYFPILIKDSCANVGPDYLQDASVWNVTNIFGWVATTRNFTEALKLTKTIDNINILEVLVKAYNESGGETVDLVVDHEVLHGVTGAMFKWWNNNINTKERYKMWCPDEHIDYRWEIPPTPQSHVGAIHVAVEKFGDYPPAGLRIRFDDPASCPVTRIYTDFGNGSILGPDDKPLVKVCHEFKETPEGIKMRSTFRVPARTPRKFIEALRKHNLSEMGHFPEFLPELYKREASAKN